MTRASVEKASLLGFRINTEASLQILSILNLTAKSIPIKVTITEPLEKLQLIAAPPSDF